MPSSSKIDVKLIEIEINLVSQNHDIATSLIENALKFVPYMTEEQRDFFNSLKYANSNSLPWSISQIDK